MRSSPLLYQLRIHFSEEFSQLVRNNKDHKIIRELNIIFKDYQVEMRSQYDAFCDYLHEAEKNGVEDYPLYKWTKATI